jgi:hypothetical protein
MDSASSYLTCSTEVHESCLMTTFFSSSGRRLDVSFLRGGWDVPPKFAEARVPLVESA